MDATTWKRAGWLTAGTRMVEVDGTSVVVVADGGHLLLEHGQMRYQVKTTTTAGRRTCWVCPVCGRRCWRLGWANVMLGCGACCALAKRTKPPRRHPAADRRHEAEVRADAALELASVVWGWARAGLMELACYAVTNAV